jgi:HTH-type transcriptional regulator, sugar sensing transcriptional regulator
MVVNIIRELTAAGLTEYEAKAYTGLLRSSEPLTSYEIAKASQIPTSKIYEVVDRLVDREIIQPVETGGTKKYSALGPSEFIAQHRYRMETSLTRLSKGLSSLKKDTNRSTIFNVSEYDLLLDKASRMIDEARKEILLSVWGEEFDCLADHILKTDKRKVKTATVHFGEPVKRAGQLFVHPIADTIYSEKGGRGLVIVADSREALVGTIYSDGSVEGGVSGNAGFVTLAEDYIKHDIYIMKIVNRYNDELIRRFGDNFSMLRDIFSDKEERS